MTAETDLNPHAQSVVEDYDAIRDVVRLCLDGEATGDVGKLREAFHDDARMFGSLAGERYDVPISALMEMSASAGDCSRRGVLGDRVVHRLPVAVAHQRALEDREQVVRPHGRRTARVPVARGRGHDIRRELVPRGSTSRWWGVSRLRWSQSRVR